MSIPLKIPINSQPSITGNIFSAAFNVPTLNRYDFTNTAANQNVNVLQLEKWAVYVIERINFAANIPQGEYLEAIDTAGGLPDFQLSTTASNQQIFPNRQPLINYVDNLEVIQVFRTQQDNDFLRVSFRGLFAQTAALVGVGTLYAFLQMNIYKIQDVEWIQKFYGQKTGMIEDYHLKGNY